MSTSKTSRTPTVPTPQEYAAFVGQLELLDVWLIDGRIENHHGPRTPRQAGVAVRSSEPTWTETTDGFDVRFPYDVIFSEGASERALLSATFGLHFSSRQPMTDAIFDVFKDVNLPVNTWPFLREFVSATLGRMGWQPFTLPALKVGVPDDEDDVEKSTVPQKRRRPRARRGEVANG